MLGCPNWLLPNYFLILKSWFSAADSAGPQTGQVVKAMKSAQTLPSLSSLVSQSVDYILSR
jgi:hypothetical protein